MTASVCELKKVKKVEKVEEVKKQNFPEGTRVSHKKLGFATVKLTNFTLHPGLDETYIFIRPDFVHPNMAEVVLVDVESLHEIKTRGGLKCATAT